MCGLPIQLVVTDMDDTLLNSSHEVSEFTARAIADVLKTGVRVVLASGRIATSVLAYARQLGLTAPAIAGNGSQIIDTVSGKMLYECLIPVGLTREVCRHVEFLGEYVQVYYGDSFFYAKECERAQEYRKVSGLNGVQTHQPLSLFVDKPTPKILISAPPEQISALQPKLAKRYEGRLNAFISRPDYIELTRPEANKSAALQKVCVSLGVKREQVLAFGDSQNDVGMLRWAGTGVAMGNARPEVLTQADEITLGNDADGVAVVLRKLLNGRGFSATSKKENI